jgi:hypothetical protein
MTVREEPQRNANGAYLCATCYLLRTGLRAAEEAKLRLPPRYRLPAPVLQMRLVRKDCSKVGVTTAASSSTLNPWWRIRPDVFRRDVWALSGRIITPCPTLSAITLLITCII